MKNKLPDPRQQRVAIWGAGREGTASWTWLRNRYPDAPLQLWDNNPQALRQPRLQQDDALQTVLLNNDQPLPEADVVIKSPGISLYQARIEQARQHGTQFTSGSNLWRLLNPEAPVIAVTGTKGKSTTAALLAHLLRHAGHRVQLAGNIGQPLLATPEAQADWWVVELSSYQLADLNWNADTAILLNLYQEHLDWHGSLQQYRQDKLRIFADHQLRICPALFQPLPFRGGQWLRYGVPDNVHMSEAYFCLNHQPLYRHELLRLPGRHNRMNACAALTALHALGFDLRTLQEGLASFRGLPHRLQNLGEHHGMVWINDSISTTPEAALAALEAMGENRPVTLIVGGHDRGLDWSEFAHSIGAYPNLTLLALPDSGHRLLAEHPNLNAYRVENLEEAVHKARKLTPKGGLCLLSPGSPSYGMFSNYEQRGAAFAELVLSVSRPSRFKTSST